MTNPKPPDKWASGDLYEPYVGRWSRLVAREFLDWLQVPPRREWLDVGCGTGALTRTILDRADPLHVHGIDPSRGFLDYARSRIIDGHASFALGDAQMLPETDGSFDVAVSGLVLNFVPAADRAASEMMRVVRPGTGIVGVYVWDYAGRMEMMRHFWDAVVALNPDAVALDPGRRFALCSAEQLHALFMHAGMREVETRSIEVPTVFRDFADYWTPFLAGQGEGPAYVMSLDPARREKLRDRVHATLPIAADGTIPLVARAWAVRGRAPPH
jgi:SAM-dependent methyltransferase